METVLFIIGGIVFLIFAFSAQGKNNQGPKPRVTDTAKRKKHVAPPFNATLDRAPKTHAPFDSKSAEPQRVQNTIKGAAYVIDGDSLVIKKSPSPIVQC